MKVLLTVLDFVLTYTLIAYFFCAFITAILAPPVILIWWLLQ